MRESVGGNLIEQIGQALAKPGEIGFGRQRAFAITAAMAGKRIDQINVGGKIQLATAELAQAEHGHILLRALFGQNRTMCAFHIGQQRIEPYAQGLFGNPGTAGQCLLDVVDAGHITPDQFDRLCAPPAPD